MDPAERELVFRLGVKGYQEGLLSEAIGAFRCHVEEGSDDPRHLSYYGLLLAVAEGNVTDGLELCERAVQEAPLAAEAHRNLARLHVHTGWHSMAAEVLRSGLARIPRDRVLLQELRRVSPRRRPFFGFLGRRNVLNKYVGLLQSQVLQRVAGMRGKAEK